MPLISILYIILILIGLLSFIYFGVLVPVFILTNRSKIRYFEILKSRYGLHGENKMSRYTIVNPIIEGYINGLKVRISVVLSRTYYVYNQKYSQPLLEVKIEIPQPTSLNYSIIPKCMIMGGKSNYSTGVQDFDSNIIVSTNQPQTLHSILRPLIIEQMLSYRKEAGKYAFKIQFENNQLVLIGKDAPTNGKKLERSVKLIEIALSIAKETVNISVRG